MNRTCEFCKRIFSTNSNMNKHKNFRCPNKKKRPTISINQRPTKKRASDGTTSKVTKEDVQIKLKCPVLKQVVPYIEKNEPIEQPIEDPLQEKLVEEETRNDLGVTPSDQSPSGDFSDRRTTRLRRDDSHFGRAPPQLNQRHSGLLQD